MGFSHRDHRAERAERQAFVGVAALVGGISVVALLTQSAVVGLGALGAFAALGAAFVVRSEHRLTRYTHDLRAMCEGETVSGWVRAEAGGDVERERPVGVPSRRSPNTRRRRPNAGAAPPPVRPAS
jgi:hypothetical protein